MYELHTSKDLSASHKYCNRIKYPNNIIIMAYHPSENNLTNSLNEAPLCISCSQLKRSKNLS